MDAPLQKKEKELNKNQIVYNVEKPELQTAPEKNVVNPQIKLDEEKKEMQEKQLDKVLTGVRKYKLNKKFSQQSKNPELFKPKAQEKESVAPPYQELKKENLKLDSISTNKIANDRITTDRKKANYPDDEKARMHFENQHIALAKKEKLDRMLKFAKTELDQMYIKCCCDLDECMKNYDAIVKYVVKDEKLRKEALKKAKLLMDQAEKDLKRVIKMMEAEKPKSKTEKGAKKAATKKTGESETKKEKKEKKVKTETKVKTENKKKGIITGDQEVVKTSGTRQRNKKPVTRTIKNENLIRNEINQQNILNGEQKEYVTYEHYDGKRQTTYVFLKQEPKNLNEAIERRAQITRNFDVLSPNCPLKPLELYLYYEDFVDRFSKTEEIQYPPEYLKMIDVSNCTLETVVMLRNRIMNRGLLYKDLKGKAKEAYDYYDRFVQHMISTDGTMKERVEQHEKRNVPNYDVKLDTNLGEVYEKQVPGSMDCWSCAGSAVLNHYLRKKNVPIVTQQAFRAYKPTLKKQDDMGLDDETYQKQKDDIETFTIKNRQKARIGSPMGNPYMIADFYLEKLEQAGEKNTAVRKMVFQPARAVKQTKGLTNNQGQSLGKDTNALENLRVKFMDVVKEAIGHDSALTLLCGFHYYTIVGIKGNKLVVHNSSHDPATETQELLISDVLRDSEQQKAVELMWLQKIENPQEVTNQFKNVAYDPNTKQFSEKVKNYSENIAQNKGVGAWKNLNEKEDDIADLVMDGIYLPKQFSENA